MWKKDGFTDHNHLCTRNVQEYNQICHKKLYVLFDIQRNKISISS